MLYDAVADDDEVTRETLLAAYAAELSAVVDARGVESVVEATALDRATVEAVVAGDVADLRLAEASEILSLAEGIAAEDVTAEVRDHLMLGMTTAILDVDTIAAEIDADLTGQEVQQAIEGRTRLTLGELAEMQALVDERSQH
ncbi:DUF5791 family protein [Candidatus Halobonum tyrrellensis]|uniref:Uncharacterized protein n=1 Tax=Candidatus Halobonum tyrrellensis G22 TaxID=1324957 RepID=V4GUQ9_9EURY|nr:DUF5791 family protein [Candidatus Halobonum tyrrellensis]ESP88861.1 hypothetical protein K933_06782 [Candidatus Halobonum tyrrellensis G22]